MKVEDTVAQRKWIKKLRNFLITFSCMLVLLEVLLRCTGKMETYSEQNQGTYVNPYEQQPLRSQLYIIWEPNDTIALQQEEFNYTYLSNNDGFIDRRDLEDCDPSRCTIFLGDSFVFGIGAPQDSSVVASLERKALACGEDQQYFNAGMPGSDPFFETRLIDQFFVPKGYNKFIINVNLSDISDFIFRGGKERFVRKDQIRYRKAPWFERWYRWSHIVRALIHGPFRMDYTLMSKKALELKRTEAINAYSELLKETYFRLQKSGIELQIIFQPYPSQYNKNGAAMQKQVNDYAPVRAVYNKLLQAKIPCINLEKNFAKVLHSGNYLQYSWAVDGHFNSKGYALYAGFIDEEI